MSDPFAGKRARLLDEEPSRTVVHYRVPVKSPFFDGHFPDKPVYPAVAQLVEIILPAARRKFGDNAISELKRVKWHQPIKPGDALTITLWKKSSESSWIHFEISCSQKPACTGTMIFQKQANNNRD